MGRTLHYAIYDNAQNYWEARRDIRIAQELLIYRFSWTAEWPSLRILDETDRLQCSDDSRFKSRHPLPVADGFTKVCFDDWNAAIIARFVTWVSRRLPHARVTLHDEGDYLSADYHVLRAGVTDLDHDVLTQEARYLTENEHWDRLGILEGAIKAFRRGEIHRPIPAREYGDCREIQALGLPPEALARMTLDEVADAIAFPWTTEGLKAA
ncbi:MAG: hypothetical protein JWM10_4154 [Myxococcaceae bacterium]|nr:hypothetical protein [Myxococcaceae bacterium]